MTGARMQAEKSRRILKSLGETAPSFEEAEEKVKYTGQRRTGLMAGTIKTGVNRRQKLIEIFEDDSGEKLPDEDEYGAD